MAPEQTPGLTATERSDLFAVGALLFHALTGGTLYACAGAPTPDEFARGQRPLASLRHFAPWLDASLVAVDVAATTRDDPSVSACCVSTETSDGPATSTQVLAPCRVRARDEAASRRDRPPTPGSLGEACEVRVCAYRMDGNHRRLWLVP